MPYLPQDHLMWDFWFAPHREGEPWRLFYLRAPASLADPEDRHWQAEVGHAVSDDLLTWHDRGVALTPSTSPAWDDKAIWTGSIIEHGGVSYWFYTALTHQDHAQRIGLATSTDLHTWHRHAANPLLEADPRWYESFETSEDGHVAFRDPWVIRHPGGHGWLMYITARANEGPMDERGVVGLARSRDLLHWTLGAPVSTPGDFGELEVPQYLHIGDRHYLLFCTGKPSSERRRREPYARWTGTHYLVADGPEGPWSIAPDPPMAADEEGQWYAGRVVEDAGRKVFLAWRRKVNGRFLGGLSRPVALDVSDDGRLSVDLIAL